MSPRPWWESDAGPARRAEVAQLRLPPQSVEAEQSVLGGVMLSRAAWSQVADMLREEDFYRRDHQLIFRAIGELAEKKQPFDAVTLGDWMEDRGLAEVVSPAYLITLASTVPSAANVKGYAAIVRDKHVLRQLIELGTGIVNGGFAPDGRETTELLAEAHSGLLALTAGRADSGPVGVKDACAEWYEALERRFNEPDVIPGIVTPWSTFNELTQSLEPGHLVVVAGRPSMGKSAYGVNLALGVSMADAPKGVLYFDLESTRRAIYNRCVARVGGVPLRWLRDPARAEGDYWAEVASAARLINKAPLRIDDTPGLSVQRIIARARMAYEREPYSLLVVDHLHLIRLPGKTSEVTEYGHATAALKELAKELGITVVLLAQLNRSLETRADRRPIMADLRGSGNIEQDADVIVFLYRDDYYAERERRASKAPGLVELIVAKQREGENGTAYALADLSRASLDDVDAAMVQQIIAGAVSAAGSASDDFEPKPQRRGMRGAAGKSAATA